jgi:hypothetical protein
MIKMQDLILENYQLAIKLYGDALTPTDIDFLTKLSNRDYTFKSLADLLLQDSRGWSNKDWQNSADQLRNYHKNIFPIKNFDFDSTRPMITPRLMKLRANIITTISEWPKIAKRNLRKDIGSPRNEYEFYILNGTVEHIDVHLRYLTNRTEKQRISIYNKIFSSDHPTFKEVLHFVDDKVNLLSGGSAYTKEELYDLVKQNDYDLRIVYDKNNVVVVDVTGQSGIKLIGCNSLWCFTYGNEYGKAGEQWDYYSYNGHVYAIIDFNEDQTSPDFIHILIRPFKESPDPEEEESGLYNMANEEIGTYAPDIIKQIAKGDSSIFGVFKWEEF